MSRLPPQPDITIPPSYSRERVLEVIYVADRSRRAVLTETSGSYRVHVQRWDVSDWDYTEQASWLTEDQFATMASSLEIARALAAEELHIPAIDHGRNKDHEK